MTHSAAAELVRWSQHRDADIRNARKAVEFVRLCDSPRDRATALNTLHTAINIVRTDVRMITFEAEQLSLCPCGLPPVDCRCIAPF